MNHASILVLAGAGLGTAITAFLAFGAFHILRGSGALERERAWGWIQVGAATGLVTVLGLVTYGVRNW